MPRPRGVGFDKIPFRLNAGIRAAGGQGWQFTLEYRAGRRVRATVATVHVEPSGSPKLVDAKPASARMRP